MKRNLATPSLNSLPRCTHIYASGRRCRSSSSAPDSLFCHRHQPKEDSAAGLVRDLDQFRSAADVTVFLSRLISTLSKDQISTRRAAVLSYVAISLMHALRTMHREHEANSTGTRFDPLPFTWAMPRPGTSGFVNIHDARAFYAQQYADDMRKKAEASFSEDGLTSHYAPYRLDILYARNAAEAEKIPDANESPLQAYSRLRS
jgi:hypothetical protein